MSIASYAEKDFLCLIDRVAVLVGDVELVSTDCEILLLKLKDHICLLLHFFVFYQKVSVVVNIHRIIDTADEITALLSKTKNALKECVFICCTFGEDYSSSFVAFLGLRFKAFLVK